MKILAINNDKAIIYKENGVCKFIVARLADKKKKVGDNIDKYLGGDNNYFRELKDAILNLYGIRQNFETVQIVMDDVDLEDYGIFECKICGETKEISECCTEHYDKSDKICKDCCDSCQERYQFYDDENRKSEERWIENNL